MNSEVYVVCYCLKNAIRQYCPRCQCILNMGKIILCFRSERRIFVLRSDMQCACGAEVLGVRVFEEPQSAKVAIDGILTKIRILGSMDFLDQSLIDGASLELPEEGFNENFPTIDFFKPELN